MCVCITYVKSEILECIQKLFIFCEIFIANIYVFSKKSVYSMSGHFKHVTNVKSGPTEYRGLLIIFILYNRMYFQTCFKLYQYNDDSRDLL